MAKFVASEVADELVSKCMRMMGSSGAYQDGIFDRLLREVKALQIGGGTSEVLKNLIAKTILKETEFKT
jgi:alkylation response protein AidB-like acyl-CoA dehydrogenase